MTWEEIKKIHDWLPSNSEGWHQHENGNGWVCDSATVAPSSYINESSVVGSTPIYIQGSRYYVTYVGCDLVQSGCITKPLKWWLENVERCAEEYGYSEVQQQEYRLHVEHIAAWMKLYGFDKLPTDSQIPTVQE